MKALIALLLLVSIPAAAEDEAIVITPKCHDGELIGFYMMVPKEITIGPGTKEFRFQPSICSFGDA